MSALPTAKPENISNLLNMDQEYPAPPIVAGSVLQRNWYVARERSAKDPQGFWADYAEQFEWSQPWRKVLEWNGVHHQWFTGAKTNITINALDRHARSELRNRAAFIWLGEDGTERIVTYGGNFEAQKLLAEYLLAIYPIMRVEAMTDITNSAELRALEKAGFTREGVVRKAQWRTGNWHDMALFSKLRGE